MPKPSEFTTSLSGLIFAFAGQVKDECPLPLENAVQVYCAATVAHQLSRIADALEDAGKPVTVKDTGGKTWDELYEDALKNGGQS